MFEMMIDKIDLISALNYPILQQFEPIGIGLAGLACLLPILGIVIWIAIGIWMYKDAEKRDENGVLWLIVGLVAGIIGVIIWLVVRPDMDEVMRKRREKQWHQQQYQPPPQQQYQQQYQPPPKQDQDK